MMISIASNHGHHPRAIVIYIDVDACEGDVAALSKFSLECPIP